MTVTKFSPKKIRVSVSVSVNSEQTCMNHARPTTFLNFGSSQNISGGRTSSPSPTRASKRKTRSCSPILKRAEHHVQRVPKITVTEPQGMDEGDDTKTSGTDWREVAKQLEESSKKARQRERRKKAKKAKKNWKRCIWTARAAIKFSWLADANLNLPIKPQMNDGRALKALNFEDIAEIDDNENWATILASQWLSRLVELENIRSLIIEAMKTGKKYRVPRKKGVYYTFDMVSKEFCDIHEAFQHFRKKFVELYGEKIPELGEEEMKIFNQWMEHWLDQKLNDFNIAKQLQAKCGIWR